MNVKSIFFYKTSVVISGQLFYYNNCTTNKLDIYTASAEKERIPGLIKDVVNKIPLAQYSEYEKNGTFFPAIALIDWDNKKNGQRYLYCVLYKYDGAGYNNFVIARNKKEMKEVFHSYYPNVQLKSLHIVTVGEINM